MFEDGFVRLGGARPLSPCLEPAAQSFALLLRSLEPLMKQISLAPALCQLGTQPSAARQTGDNVA